MSTPADRRTRKRLATRKLISDTATRLFFERGFDRVTVDDIADASDVGRMTVFNHFPRKEDMFFDLDEEGRDDLTAALKQRGVRTPVEALRVFAHDAFDQQKPYLRFSEKSRQFLDTVRASEALKGRARAIRDELTDVLRAALSESVGRGSDDPEAHLAATLQIGIWAVAFLEAHHAYQLHQDAAAAKTTFLALVDKGAIALRGMLKGSPYALATRGAKH
jgi:AcrR family transcriptional regulator